QSQGCGRCNLSCCESQDFCPQDCLYAKEEGQEFIEKMKQRLKKVQPNPQSEQPLDNSAAFLQKGEGFLTKCSYQVGEKTCGKCYCLKANPGSSIVFNGRQLRGCARLEISLVGDLAAFVDQAVYYEGISEFNSSFICPQHFKLLRIKPVAEKLENF
ncbi:MAG: hypothetical protein KKG91_00180, partial [Candidatus Omnitrophica bacterium]|nr:hypothetical protein [Candidatus Omnitrophota bacterium]